MVLNESSLCGHLRFEDLFGSAAEDVVDGLKERQDGSRLLQAITGLRKVRLGRLQFTAIRPEAAHSKACHRFKASPVIRCLAEAFPRPEARIYQNTCMRTFVEADS